MNSITTLGDAQGLLQNSASQEIYGTSYEDAINTTVLVGGLAVLATAGAYAGTAVARGVGGFEIAGVLTDISAKVGSVGTWLAKPKAVLIKAGTKLASGVKVGVFAKGVLWTIAVAVASALGLTIGNNLYNKIESEKPEAWVWLDEQLTAMGWREFDFALTENGLTYLPTAIVELYRDWFEYLGFFNAGGIDRTLTNESLIVTDFSTVPFNDAFSEYLNIASFQKIIQMMQENGLTFSERDYMVLGYESNYSIRMYYFKNVEQFRYNSIGAYSRNENGKLNNFVTYITCDESWYFNVSSWGDVDVKETATKQEIEFRTRDKYSSATWLQDNLGKLVPSIEGVGIQSGATIPTVGTDLSITYPDWYSKKISFTTPNTSVDYVPVSIPRVDPTTFDTVLPQVDAQSGIVIETPFVKNEITAGTQSAVDSLVNVGVNVQANPPMTPIGSTPINPTTPFDPIGMMAVYNPTINEVNEFSRFLWTTDFVDNIKKLFLDPFQGIIGFFQLYATPIVAETKTEISIGWLGTNVMANRVTNKFIEIDCGTITPWQYFGNVLDFNPYTSVKLYLPFIGIVPLNPNHIIGANVNLRYKIDVTTATCVANIYCNNELLYTFNGNCGVQIPLTGANYSAIASGLLTIASGVVTGGASGVITGIGGITQMKTQLQQSGSLGANAGVLSPRIPYFIIERPIAYDALDYPKYYGIPANELVQLSTLSGFTKIKNVQIENVPATIDEIDMIQNILMEGVIL